MSLFDHSDRPDDADDRLGSRNWEPISIKTAWRFMANFFQVLYFLRGVLILLLLFIAAGALTIWLFEEVELFDGIYFSLITALTIGYGDIVPMTATGKIVSILLGLLGEIFVGIMVGASIHALMFTLKSERE